ncbi:uncharacterized protein LOC131178813 [Hevea brasiliensis]|uniref:uncharacterized protein LOC131178813 n=1 Tax=Hevea brasiliensis TaxID=3981 RepID=UPI0025FC824C|nr:uncharacterized protein LOC131178813 [Hevea brasiliensis]
MYYFPLTPRLQKLYASEATAAKMRWHAEHNIEDDVMCHLSDSEAWKHFNRTHPMFAVEIRNVRLGLCTDEFQPFGQSGQQYSCWPVIITPYNLPPGMCMKEPYLFLSIIVPGPQNPKHRLDVYLQPLIVELTQLWHVGVQTYDASKKQNFQMYAALMWTISDFPAYSMLSGWSTAGRLACPYCVDYSDAFSLSHGGKISWFDNHRKFLPQNHPFRRNRVNFLKGKACTNQSPPIINSEDTFLQIEDLGLRRVTDNDGEAINAAIARNTGWRKRSIFWDLPYWSSNLIRHNLDVMHIKKNIFENNFNTVMNIEGKTKDNAKAREDITQLCRRKELEKDVRIGKYPKACYTLDKQQKQKLCEWRLLPIAFREFLPNTVWQALIELSLFFKNLTATNIKVQDMERLEVEIPIIICKLERIFPPAFFDSMEHIPIHLPYETKIAGPVQYRWMYPFERFLGHLKKNVKNKAKVEGSICNAYLVEEASNFCAHYFESHVITWDRQVPRNDDGGDNDEIEENLSIFKYPGRPYGRAKTRWLGDDEYKAAHIYVLLNCPKIDIYLKMFHTELQQTSHNISDAEVNELIEQRFSNWFKSHARSANIDNKFIKDLAEGPLKSVISYPVYFINGYRFHTINHGVNRSTMNSGVCIRGSTYGDTTDDYYGLLKEVIQLEYPALPIKRVVLFKCEWFDITPNVGIKVHKHYNLVDINHRKRLNKYEPFILASQAEQMVYIPYPSLRRDKADWYTVCKVKPRATVVMPQINVTEPILDQAFQNEAVQVLQIDTEVADEHIGPLDDPSGEPLELASVKEEE